TPVYKTNDSLNVRSEPSKTGQKLGVLVAGTVVDYVKAYDDVWAVINYNGTEGYVASQYLIHD
ncbi:MAG: SH3 domain-containing protein, partial [Hungatella sp.]